MTSYRSLRRMGLEVRAVLTLAAAGWSGNAIADTLQLDQSEVDATLGVNAPGTHQCGGQALCRCRSTVRTTLTPEHGQAKTVCMPQVAAAPFSVPYDYDPDALKDAESARKAVKCLELHDLGYRPGESAPPQHDITDGRELPYVIAQQSNPVPSSIHAAYAGSFREVPLQWVESALDRSWLSGLKMYAYHPGGEPGKPTLVVAKRSVFQAFLPWIPMRKKRYCHPTPGQPRSINYECTDFAEEAQAWCVQFGHSACARTLDLFAHHSWCWGACYEDGADPDDLKAEDIVIVPFEPQAGVVIPGRNPANHYDGRRGESQTT